MHLAVLGRFSTRPGSADSSQKLLLALSVTGQMKGQEGHLEINPDDLLFSCNTII